MKCPACGTPDLLMTERQGIEIDYCPKCRGVWLDRGELDKFIEKASEAMAAKPPVVAPPVYRPEDRGSDYPSDEQKRFRREQERYERERMEREHRQDYDDRDDRHYRGKKRGSFWGDLFDFD